MPIVAFCLALGAGAIAVSELERFGAATLIGHGVLVVLAVGGAFGAASLAERWGHRRRS